MLKSERLYGGKGSDFLSGGEGEDSLLGGPGDDEVRGGPGDDRIESEFGEQGGDRDTVYGDAGNDFIVDGYGERHGGGGNDLVSVQEGDSVVYGGSGRDQVNVGTAGEGDVGHTYTVNGGSGEDAIGLISSGAGEAQIHDTNIYDAVDGERDSIHCWNVKSETVRVDPLDTFFEDATPFNGEQRGREFCDSLTVVE